MADDKAAKKTDPRVAAARQRAAMMAKKGAPSFSWSKVWQFCKEAWLELKKTTWPDRQTLYKSTLIVLAFIVATGVWNGVLDLLLTHATAHLFGN